MSTIKSSDEHLTLNADGASKDIKFQANGVEKASISSAGAFTSTTIDATKLTGTIPNFTSTGIDDNADATAITIDSSERVGIGTGNPDANLHIRSALTNQPVFKLENTYESGGGTATVTGNAPIIELYANDTGTAQPDSQELGIIEFRGENKDSSAEELYARIVGTNGDANTTGELKFETQQSNTMTTALTIRGDRGLSQFTAKAWLTYNHENTPSILDSHNISSVTDRGTGLGTMNFANAMGNTNYCVVGSALDGGGENDNRHFNHSAGSTETTSAFDFFTGYVDISGVYEGRTVANDCSRVSVHVFGD